MISHLGAFLAIGVAIVLTPGPATALVVRNSLRGGPRAALATTAGNSTGILGWALASVLGISALVAASEAAFVTLKAVGAVVLVWIGVQSWRRARRAADDELIAAAAPRAPRTAANAYREGLVTSFANPKLAVFFLALFPQFVPDGAAVLPATLLMVVLIVGLDIVWFSILAFLVTRARRALVDQGMAAWLERVSGTILVALGLRLAVATR